MAGAAAGEAAGEPDPELAELRARMDRLNERLFDLLDERVRLAARIAERKRGLGLPILDPAREADEVAAARARDGALSPDARDRILRAVLEETRRAQAASGDPG